MGTGAVGSGGAGWRAGRGWVSGGEDVCGDALPGTPGQAAGPEPPRPPPPPPRRSLHFRYKKLPTGGTAVFTFRRLGRDRELVRRRRARPVRCAGPSWRCGGWSRGAERAPLVVSRRA